MGMCRTFYSLIPGLHQRLSCRWNPTIVCWSEVATGFLLSGSWFKVAQPSFIKGIVTTGVFINRWRPRFILWTMVGFPQHHLLSRHSIRKCSPNVLETTSMIPRLLFFFLVSRKALNLRRIKQSWPKADIFDDCDTWRPVELCGMISRDGICGSGFSVASFSNQTTPVLGEVRRPPI